MKLIFIAIGIVVAAAVAALWYGTGFVRLPSSPPGTETQNATSSLSLNLRNQGIEKLPAYVFGLTNLRELDISSNRLTGALPAEIRHLQNLEVLDASYNQMTGVPAEIGQLTRLRILNLSHNKLTGLPHELGNLQNLQVLNLSGNQYSQQDVAYIRARLPATTEIILQ